MGELGGLHDLLINPSSPKGGSESTGWMGTFYVFPNGGVCLWAICADGVMEFPFLPCHGSAVDNVLEACHLIRREVTGMAIKGGQVSSGV
jgi:hypothetical protein